ncbi:MAG: hypothetical protein AAF991_03585 [Pseudomonadota bacterium]
MNLPATSLFDPPKVFAFCLGVFVAVAASAQDYRLTMAPQPINRNVISTGAADTLSFLASDGIELRFSRNAGREEMVQGIGFLWAQVQQVPVDAESLRLTPQRLEDGSIVLAIEASLKQNDLQQSISTTVTTQADEWIRIFGPVAASPGGVKQYSTRKTRQDSLYVKVELLN